MKETGISKYTEKMLTTCLNLLISKTHYYKVFSALKLIQKSRLRFEEGRSNKVYEIDLLQTGEDQFLVNFRYGRYGSALREGTKTAFPVTKAKAQTIYETLLQEKTKKGYWEDDKGPLSAEPQPEQQASPSFGNPLLEQIQQKIYQHLENNLKEQPNSREVGRLFWRAGVYKAVQCRPLIISWLKANKNQTGLTEYFSLYSALAALVRMPSQDGKEAFVEVANKSQVESLSMLAALGYVLTATPQEKKEFLRKIENQILAEVHPSTTWKDLHTAPIRELYTALVQAMENQQHGLLGRLYLLSFQHPQHRSLLKKLLVEVPFKAPFFKSYRALFKLIEIKQDHEFLALCAFRFDTESSTHSTQSWIYVPQKNKYKAVRDEVKEKDSTVGYTLETRRYFTARMERYSEDLAIAHPQEYVFFATELLLQFEDAIHEKSPYQLERTDWDSGKTSFLYYDSYSTYALFNLLLHKNHPAYFRNHRKGMWQYDSTKANEECRGEPFPQLWDEACQEVLRILSATRCKPVAFFALRVWKSNKNFAQQFHPKYLNGFLNAPFESIRQIALDWIQEQAKILPEWTPYLLGSSLPELHTLAFNAIRKDLPAFLNHPDALFSLCLYRENHYEILQWIQQHCFTVDFLDECFAQFAMDLVDSAEEQFQHSTFTLKIESLFAPLFQAKPFHFETHPFASLTCAGQLFFVLGFHLSKTPLEKVPSEMWELLLSHQHTYVRTLAIEKWVELPPSKLVLQKATLISFVLSPHQEIRTAVHSVVGNCCKMDQAFARELIGNLLFLIKRPEAHAGLHKDLCLLLTGPLDESLLKFGAPDFMALLRSEFASANQIGAHFLAKESFQKKLNLQDWVELASHEKIILRETSWAWFSSNLTLVGNSLSDAIALLDSPWEDTRIFAQEFFRAKIPDSLWTPPVLVALCDSVESSAQSFGRNLLTQYFADEKGTEILLALAEHPSQNMQQFTSQLLEKYAGGDASAVLKMKAYFSSVFAKINTGRVAKERAYAFLVSESLKSKSVARFAMPLFYRYVPTIVIKDQAPALQSLLLLSEKYPELWEEVQKGECVL